MVGSIIVGAAAGVSAAGVAASFALTAAAFAVNFAVSIIVSRVFGQSGQGPQDSGTRQQVPPSNINAIPIVYGDAYLGGTFVDAVLSTDQKTMYYVVAVSCISPNGQFTFDSTKFYYGDRLVTFDGTDQTKVVSLTDEAGNVDTKINGNLFINLYRSTAAGSITPLNSSSAPNVVMGGADIDVALRWPSSGRQMNGLAFAIIKLNYNQDAGTTNLSPVTFYAKHYLNSTGAAKPGDVWYDYITNAAYGGAVDTDFVNASSATALNAYADQTITYTPSTGGSATQARYRMNGVLDAGQTVLSNLDKIMTCADSWMAYNAALGQWSIVINKADATSYAFDDDNIIGEVRVSATDITQSINQVEAKFPDKGSRDQPNFVNIRTPELLLYPNEPANKYSVTYDLCNDSVQAQYLANRILEQAREDLIVSFSTTYYGIQVDAGDVVSVTNADYGWTNKLFRVVKVNEASLPDGSLGAKLEMTEYSAAVYDDFDITQYTPVPNSDLPSVNYFSPLSASTVTASNPSSPIPNFNVSIAIPAVGRVTFTELYYTTAAIPTANDWRLLSTAGRIDGEPVTPGTSYVFTNQVLPTGSDPSATYYFSYVVGNDIARSNRSPTSASFTWTPVANTGPTGPTGAGTAGLNGLSFINAYKVQSQSDPTPTFTTPTSGPAIPSGWVSTTPAVAIGQILWYIQGRYNSSSSAIDGVAANTTAWTGPVAASIFQDIRSDNWNGSTPPSASVVSSWGTAGYYIAKGDGNMYANGFYARGKVQIEGNNSDLLSTAARVNQSDAAAIGVYAFGNQSSGRGIAGISSGSSGAGVVGTATASPARAGVLALATSGGTVALEVAGGAMVIDNTTLVTNLNADLLDGQHAAAFVKIASGATNGDYLYYVNNNTAPVDPVNRAAWIRVATNTGGYVYFPGYL
jgi:hypothetical protein